MIKYQYKNPFWLYTDDRGWTRIKKEIPKILILMALAGILLLIALHN
jgi:hypothetical protein